MKTMSKWYIRVKAFYFCLFLLQCFFLNAHLQGIAKGSNGELNTQWLVSQPGRTKRSWKLQSNMAWEHKSKKRRHVVKNLRSSIVASKMVEKRKNSSFLLYTDWKA